MNRMMLHFDYGLEYQSNEELQTQELAISVDTGIGFDISFESRGTAENQEGSHHVGFVKVTIWNDSRNMRNLY